MEGTPLPGYRPPLPGFAHLRRNLPPARPYPNPADLRGGRGGGGGFSSGATAPGVGEGDASCSAGRRSGRSGLGTAYGAGGRGGGGPNTASGPNTTASRRAGGGRGTLAGSGQGAGVPPTSGSGNDPSTFTQSSAITINNNPALSRNEGDTVVMLRQSQEMIRKLDTKFNQLDSKMDRCEAAVAAGFNDLKKLMVETEKKSFSIKGSKYEPDLRRAMANIFCFSETRYPEDGPINNAIKSVLSRSDYQKVYIMSSALKSCKEYLSTFRTEERRKVLGVSPYERSCFKTTDDLCKEITDLFKAPAEVHEAYTLNLAILRKYVRETPGVKNVPRFHEHAKKWILSNILSEEDRQRIKEEDIQHPYSEFPITYPHVQHLEPNDLSNMLDSGFEYPPP